MVELDRLVLEEQYIALADAAYANGLGYAITDGGYIKESMTDDPKLREAIKQAREALETIEKILEPYMP